MNVDLCKLSEINTSSKSCADDAFVLFASPEHRCLGVVKRFGNYSASRSIVLHITDEENAERENNREAIRGILEQVSDCVDQPMRHDDPICGVTELAGLIQEAQTPDGWVTIDISTFPRNSLLLTLRAIDTLQPRPNVRLLYTEPGDYIPAISRPISSGLCQIGSVPTFSAPYTADQELVLVVFLGFERDRVLGLWQSIGPHKTIAVIGDPPYRPEWRGVSERINAALLAGVPEGSIFRVDPLNPLATYGFIRQVIGESPARGRDNFYLAPLGTKPQVVGVYLYTRAFPRHATVVYASPLARDQEYITKGLGATWRLPYPQV